MKTRSSPALEILHKLAATAGLEDCETVSKPDLYERLKGRFDIDRLKRAANRGSTAYRKRPRPHDTDYDFDAHALTLPASTSSSHSSSVYRDASIAVSSSSSSSSSTAVAASSSSRTSSSSSSKRNKKAPVVKVSGKLGKSKSKSKSKGKGEGKGEDAPHKATRSSLRRKHGVAIAPDRPTLDPIMMAPIVAAEAFAITRPGGSTVLFNLEVLLDYMLSTGDFCDPETRVPFDESLMAELDIAAKSRGLIKPSVLARFKDPAYFSDQVFYRDALLGLERCAGEVVSDILAALETLDFEEAQMRLFLREFPLLADYFSQIKQADSNFAAACLKTWHAYILGPPNRPTVDACGLLPFVIRFFRELSEN